MSGGEGTQLSLVLSKFKGPRRVFGPKSISLLTSWLSDVKNQPSEQRTGLLATGKKPPCARRWACGIHRCISTSWSLEAYRKNDASQKLQLEVQGREGNPWDWASTAGAQTLPRPHPLTGNENVWLPTQQPNGSFMAQPNIILRNCWLKMISWGRAGGCCWNLSGGS